MKLPPRGLALRGALWAGGAAAPLPDGVAVVDGDGVLRALGPAGAVALPAGLPVLRGGWVGPGLVDTHVHLAFGTAEQMLAGGVTAARDLGAPLGDALRWRAESPIRVAVAGPLLTAPRGYPTRSWGANGFGIGIADPASAGEVVRELAAAGVDLVKIALEPAGGAPVPSLPLAVAIVRAAHEAGLPVVAHALTVEMVRVALDAGADELAHTPVEPLPDPVVEQVRDGGVRISSTLATLGHDNATVLANAAALVSAGVPLVYGTDLGNAGTRPGGDARELHLLAAAGLGRLAALRAATDRAAAAAGFTRHAVTGRLVVGERADLVLLTGDPLAEFSAVERPLAVVAGDRVVAGALGEIGRDPLAAELLVDLRGLE